MSLKGSTAFPVTMVASVQGQRVNQHGFSVSSSQGCKAAASWAASPASARPTGQTLGSLCPKGQYIHCKWLKPIIIIPMLKSSCVCFLCVLLNAEYVADTGK